MAVKKKIKVNGKTYDAKPFNFNTVCDLEDLGFQLMEAGTKNTKFIRAYFALCAGLSVEDAGYEIQNHMINGGTMEELSDAMGAELEKSDFFRALSKTAEAETTEVQTN